MKKVVVASKGARYYYDFEEACENPDENGLCRFDSSAYQLAGDQACCKCGDTLYSSGFTVAIADDYSDCTDWRSFCDECWNKVERLSNKQIFDKYPPSEYVSE